MRQRFTYAFCEYSGCLMTKRKNIFLQGTALTGRAANNTREIDPAATSIKQSGEKPGNDGRSTTIELVQLKVETQPATATVAYATQSIIKERTTTFLILRQFGFISSEQIGKSWIWHVKAKKVNAHEVKKFQSMIIGQIVGYESGSQILQ